MKKQEIEEYLLEYINTLLQNNIQTEITPHSKILSDQLVDSIGIISLVTFIESKFNLNMEQADMNFDNLDSVEQITEYILGKQ